MITTVTGKVKKEELGLTLAHEHLYIDCVKRVIGGTQEKLTTKNRYIVHSDPYALKDNALIDNTADLLYDLEIFYKAGGGAIVDATTVDIARNPLGLKYLSEESGVKIVMGCGRYVDDSLDQDVKNMSGQARFSEIMHDIIVGCDGVKAGVIGEIGTSAEITTAEFNSLDGAAAASVKTGLGVHVHTALFVQNGHAICDFMLNKGVKPQKLCINHTDVVLDIDYILSLLERGVMIEFDNFGKEFYIPSSAKGLLTQRFAYDLERCKAIKKFIDCGYLSSLLITNDICLKSMLCSYGGSGYAHILVNIMPMLTDIGIKESDVLHMLTNNIWNFLDDKN